MWMIVSFGPDYHGAMCPRINYYGQIAWALIAWGLIDKGMIARSLITRG